ncbi:unnamed protein product [Effrenium voratum]|uniref:Uncharacterized protein n=1 Tax=Effrenium voratum TaxID=2562239 RepID=A0AA36MZD9_9DINO|nr:unnamed protein product [Effrenium voratum]CAJ1385261.1 unnamed protein product [Effrenium voratum]CAJ1460189.1 unnamed protein product [Effrenium voratum]
MGAASSTDELDAPEFPAPTSGSSRSESKPFVHTEANRERQDFARFWEQYVPGGARTTTVSRPLMREVLLRAVRELALSPGHRAWAEELVANAVASAPAALAAEDAFAIFRSVMQNLRSSQGHIDTNLPARETALPLASYGKMPKGARMIDPAPVRRPSSLDVGCPSRPQDLFAPLRSTRAAQESTLASLRATVLSSQAAYEKLLAQADSCTSGPVHDLKGRLESLKAKAALDQGKLQDHAGVIQQQEIEIAALRDDLALHTQRVEAASQRLRETQDKLEEAQQENAELSRQAKTEQLRSTMLREAFEQEQTRVGLSLGHAEAQVSDLAAATEGTRRIEVEEQAVARECVTALNEIHAAQAREELATEARLTQLLHELGLAKAAAAETKTAGDDQVVAEFRRRSQEHAAVVRRRVQDAQTFRRKLQEVQQQAADVSHRLAQKEGMGGRSALANANLSTRLRLEEAEEATLQVAEARLQGELADARAGSFAVEDFDSYEDLLENGKRHASALAEELEVLRSELSAFSAAPRNADAGDDLMAAGLQRRVGSTLAAQRESQCLLQEEKLKKQLLEQQLRFKSKPSEISGRGLQREAPELPSAPSQVDAERAAPPIASQELRARLAALRGQLIGQGDDTREARPCDKNEHTLHQQLEALRQQLEA